MARSCLMAGAGLLSAKFGDCCRSSRLCLFRGLFLPSLEFRQLLTMPWDGKCFRRLPTCGGYESVTVLFGSGLSSFRGVGTCPHSEWSEVQPCTCPQLGWSEVLAHNDLMLVPQ